MNEIVNRFPADYPKEIIKKILAYSSEKDVINVYRVARNGELNEKAFFSTYKMVVLGLRNKLRVDDENSIEYYSTSCSSFKQAKCIQQLLSRPKAILLIGNIKKEKGRTDQFSDLGHINWWIYNMAKPEEDFKKYE